MDYTIFLIPVVSLLGLIYLGYRYINLFIKINKLENEFSSIVNHTFRTPLTRIMWLAKELESDLPLNQKMSHIQNIHNATERVLEIVDIVAGIKNISDLSGYYFEAVSLREITENSIEKYRDIIKEKGLLFNVSSFEEIPFLSVDLKKISFVVDSLIENAILYTKDNGHITISCRLNNYRDNLIFFVRDNGLGLSIIDKMRMFSRFYRNKKAVLLNTDGMGLCLYLSQKIIKRHHGKIYAKSNGRNKGSTFFMELPLKNSFKK